MQDRAGAVVSFWLWRQEIPGLIPGLSNQRWPWEIIAFKQQKSAGNDKSTLVLKLMARHSRSKTEGTSGHTKWISVQQVFKKETPKHPQSDEVYLLSYATTC